MKAPCIIDEPPFCLSSPEAYLFIGPLRETDMNIISSRGVLNNKFKLSTEYRGRVSKNRNKREIQVDDKE